MRPRHLSQHVGGFVLTEDRLDETVPLHWAAMDDRTYVEWDKDDIDALGLMKVDILRARHAYMRAQSIRSDAGAAAWASIPSNWTSSADDPAVYQMLSRG